MREPEELTQVDQELRRLLRRVDAPPELLRRTMESAKARSMPTRGMALRWKQWATGAIAAGLLGGAVFLGEMHARRQRAEEAQRQFDAAMRITDRTLELVRQQLGRTGVQIAEERP